MRNEAITLGEAQKWNELFQLDPRAFSIWLSSPNGINFLKHNPNTTIEVRDVSVPGLSMNDGTCPLQIEFTNIQFDHEIEFTNCTFKKGISFSECQIRSGINIKNTQVHGSVGIFFTELSENFHLSKTKIGISLNIERLSPAETSHVTLDEIDVVSGFYITDSDFTQIVEITESTFNNTTLIFGCNFLGGLNLFRSTFKGETTTSNCQIDKEASFALCRFDKYSSFQYCAFQRCVPNFNETSFPSEYPPQLDDVQISYPIAKSTLKKLFGIASSKDAHVSFRTLKKLSSLRHDHSDELRFFALEQRAKREHVYSYRNLKHAPHLLLDHLYDLLSSYGLSVFRPILGLFITISITYVLLKKLATEHGAEHPQIFLNTIANVSLLPNNAIVARNAIQQSLCENVENISCFSQLYSITAVESFFVFLFVFLFGLAIRNRLKMK